MLTRAANFDSIEKFAQNTVARPVNTTRCLTQYIQRLKFEDTKLRVLPQRWSLIQNCSLSANAVRIFDNIVERASREMTRTLVESFSLFITLRSFSSDRGTPDQSDLRPDCVEQTKIKREFDPGSESTLAACLTHASRTRKGSNT